MTHLFEGACCQPLLGLQKKVVTKTALATHEFQALNSENLALKAWVGLGAFLTYLGAVVDSETLGIQSPCQWMIGVSNHVLSKVFRFHYHSQKVIRLLWKDMV